MEGIVTFVTLAGLIVLLSYAAYSDFFTGKTISSEITGANPLKIIDVSSDGFIVYNSGEESVEQVIVIINGTLVDFSLPESLSKDEGVFLRFSPSFYRGVETRPVIIDKEDSFFNNYNGSSYLHYNTLCSDNNYCTKDSYYNNSCVYSKLSDGDWFGCFDTTGCSNNNLGSLDCSCVNGSCVDSCGNGLCEAWETSTSCLNDCSNCVEKLSECLSPNVWFHGGVNISDGSYCSCCGDDEADDNFTNNTLICSKGNVLTDADNVNRRSTGFNGIIGRDACDFMGYHWLDSSGINYSSVVNISNVFSRAFALSSSDVDNDGDVDIIGTSLYNEIGWWENKGNNSWTPHLVSAEVINPLSVFSVNIDGDNDEDIIAVSDASDAVFWFENLDGAGTNWNKTVIYSMLDGASSVYAWDVDADGDNDVIAGASLGSKMMWFENLNGRGDSWQAHVIEDFFAGAVNILTADIDNDGRIDILSAGEFSDLVVWWDLNGTMWNRNIISSEFNSIKKITAADFDNDGDTDVAGNSYYDNLIAWMENVDNGSSWVRHEINITCMNPLSLISADADNDGDADIILTSQRDNRLTLLVNSGNGESWSEHIISQSLPDSFGLSAADFDNDGDFDIIGSSYTMRTISLWKNQIINGVNGPCCGDDGSADTFSNSTHSCCSGVFKQGMC